MVLFVRLKTNSLPSTSRKIKISRYSKRLKMKKILIFLIALFVVTSTFAQDVTDTVVIKVGDGSKVIFAIKDKKDLETMKKYNFQKLMDDMIYKLEVRDSSRLNKLSSEFLKKDSLKQVAVNNEVTPVQV